MSRKDHPPWANLPEPILTHVMSFLSVLERCKIATVCKSWKSCLETPVLWKVFDCGFFFPTDEKLLAVIKKYGRYVNYLSLTLNQNSNPNRENALAALDYFASLDSSRLTHLKISFKGQNPLFYSGKEFVIALCNLLKTTREGAKNQKFRFKYLNLNEFQADIDDNFIECLSCHCKSLQYLNILNSVLVCNITSPFIKEFVEKCQNLQVLHIYHTSLSNDVFEALSQPNRVPLKRLGVVCRRQDKFGQDLSSEAWSKLLQANPDLKVELGFDHTCPLHRIEEILKPEIPVIELHLATFTRIYHEINIASSYYEETLEKVVVQTRPSKELDEALLKLAQRCKKLHSLLVYCLVDGSIKEQILNLCPEMARKGSYILKTEMEPEPWTVGKEED